MARQYVLRQEDALTGAAPNGMPINGAYATVIADHPTEISRLSVDEAVMRMDLADQQVMMFRNSATGELNVIYRRSDGNVGWIAPAG
jgi:hypothetical protein